MVIQLPKKHDHCIVIGETHWFQLDAFNILDRNHLHCKTRYYQAFSK